MKRVNIWFLEPSLITWEDAFNVARVLSAARDVRSLEQMIDRIPGIRAEFINPPGPDDLIQIEPPRVVQFHIPYVSIDRRCRPRWNYPPREDDINHGQKGEE